MSNPWLLVQRLRWVGEISGEEGEDEEEGPEQYDWATNGAIGFNLRRVRCQNNVTETFLMVGSSNSDTKRQSCVKPSQNPRNPRRGKQKMMAGEGLNAVVCRILLFLFSPNCFEFMTLFSDFKLLFNINFK